MKLLFDENISFRIVKKLQNTFPEASHVKFHDLTEVDDRIVWEFAKLNAYTIVTNDADFNDFSLIWGFPPKVIWLRAGNTSTKFIIELLEKEKEKINQFSFDVNNGILIFE